MRNTTKNRKRLALVAKQAKKAAQVAKTASPAT